MVGVKGFEPPAPCSQSTCATRLRYTPLIERAAQATLIIIFKVRPVVNRIFQIFLKNDENDVAGAEFISPIRLGAAGRSWRSATSDSRPPEEHEGGAGPAPTIAG